MRGTRRLCAIMAAATLLLTASPETLQQSVAATPKAVRVEASHGATCAITGLGAVKCWGDFINSAGVRVWSKVPLSDSSLSQSVRQLAVGEGISCVLLADGVVKCWQESDPTEGATAIDASFFDGGVKQLAVDNRIACALTGAGGVRCWGLLTVPNPDPDEVEDVLLFSSSSPSDLPGLTSGVAAVSVGGDRVCGTMSVGGVRCFGSNLGGALGVKRSFKDLPYSLEALPVTGLGGKITSLSSSGNHACAVTAAGAAKCWGSGEFGELGNRKFSSSTAPVTVYGLSKGVRSIDAGWYHTCVVTKKGAAKCWGENYDGRLGNRSRKTSAKPVNVYGLSKDVKQVTLGVTQSCALTTKGTVKCWGGNSSGELGNNSTKSSTKPVGVRGLS